MKEIIFYKSKYKKEDCSFYKTIIDDDIYDLIIENNYKITLSKNMYANISYKENNKYYKRRLHIFIYSRDLKYKSPKGYVIDHINGDRLYNCRENLREITYKQNSQNKKNKNKYIGVNYHKLMKKWLAECSSKKIGWFETSEEAAREYDKYLIQNSQYGLHLNFKYTEEEIDIIKKMKLVSNINHRSERELPMFICFYNNSYLVQIRNKEYRINIRKYCNTLQEAINIKNETLLKLEELKKQKIKNTPITKTEEGLAYIEVKYKDKIEKCIVDEYLWHELYFMCSWVLRSDNYLNGNLNNKIFYLHRYLYKKYKNNNEEIPENMIVDHKNGINEKYKRLDNRLSNLRLINYEQNAFNKITTNLLEYRGISKSGKKWEAKIIFEKECIRSKKYDTKEEAALEWNNMVLRTYGKKYGIEFVLHNLNKIKKLKTELKFID